MRIDWYEAYRRLMFGRLRLRPWEVERLTPAELAVALDDDIEERRPPAGAQPMAPTDLAGYAKQWREQSLAERLARAKEA